MEQYSRGHGQPSASTISYPNSAPVEPSARGLESRPKTHSSAETRPKEVYSCQQCSKVFNRRENLSRHVKTHDASPSHCCEKCGKGFSRSDLLKRHEAGHERWDRKGLDGNDGSSKRRKVNLDTEASSASPTSSWAAANQHPNPLAPQSDFSASNNDISTNLPSTSSQQFGRPEPTSYAFHLHPGQAPDYQAQEQLNQMHGHSFTHYSMTQEQSYNYQHFDSMSTSFVPYDFSSFLLPSGMEPQLGNEWFSHDFYSAMRENGNEWSGLGEPVQPNDLTPHEDYGNSFDQSQQSVVPLPAEPISIVPNNQEHSDENRREVGGGISRVSSPPNEASEEDKWPFQWNPSSTPILKAHAITIPDDHPLIQAHHSRFDISEASLLRLRAFLKPPSGREYHRSQKGSFVLPTLPIVNIFIRLFFEHFSPQMPVLHHPTVNTNEDLPTPLLAAIIIIGAIYSHLKHTRRFAIVLLDIVRWHLQIAIECDNNLMRDPMIIYAEALICHAGLWCGNKRAFELAEVVRGSLVTHIRRVQFGERLVTSEKAPTPEIKSSLNTDWREWIAEEARRRLAWVVYSIDCQFPSILNLPSTISIGEVCNLGCPCDDEFWFATSAKNWKNLLGPASAPPSRSFSAAVGPFILETLVQQGSTRTNTHLPILSLNSWSALLVLLAIQSQIFEFSQESLITRTFIDDGELSDEEDDSSSENGANAHNGGYEVGLSRILRKLKLKRRLQLADALASWGRAYQIPSRSNTHNSSRHFHASSIIIHNLSTILLDISLSDLQNAIGKEGTTGSTRAFARLTKWARRSPQLAEQVVCHAIKTILMLAPGKNNGEGGIRNIDTAPYSVITIFLCHIVVWAFANVASDAQKLRLLDTISRNVELRLTPFFATLPRSLWTGGDWSHTLRKEVQEDDQVEQNSAAAANLLFRSAAEMLIQLGTWGCALNLASLLHERAEM
ncbi:Fungal specific transcription factor domain containing protein [Hyaloscypha variabilis]